MSERTFQINAVETDGSTQFDLSDLTWAQAADLIVDAAVRVSETSPEGEKLSPSEILWLAAATGAANGF